MFDFTNVKPDDFSPLPNGWYKVFIDEPKWQETKAGNGEYLKLTYKVMDGDYEGRLVWDNLNLINQNEKAVEIAFKTIVKLLSALGYEQDQLAGVEKYQILEMLDQKELLIKLKQHSDSFGDKNKVVDYKSVTAKTEDPKSDIPW